MRARRSRSSVRYDTNGFHRRGSAREGAERFAVYGAMRRSPLLP